MSRRAAGFTLIELLVVIAILGILATALLPNVLGASTTANIAADGFNLQQHYQWLLDHKKKKLPWPKEGGHKFVLAPWINGCVERTAENRDRYFTPGLDDDPHWQDLRTLDPKTIWRTAEEVTPEDTHYAGRSGQHLRGMWQGDEALMANDNDGLPAFNDGTINVLMASGAVRSLEKGDELREFWNDDDPDFYVEVGPGSPVEMLQKLER